METWAYTVFQGQAQSTAHTGREVSEEDGSLETEGEENLAKRIESLAEREGSNRKKETERERVRAYEKRSRKICTW